jgi:hypothetical protein
MMGVSMNSTLLKRGTVLGLGISALVLLAYGFSLLLAGLVIAVVALLGCRFLYGAILKIQLGRKPVSINGRIELTKRQRQISLLENLLAFSKGSNDERVINQVALLQATLKSLKAEEAREQKVDQQIEKLEALLAARTGGDTRP